MSLLFVIACATTKHSGDKIQTAEAHYKIGVSYLNDAKAQQAFVEFQRAYELNPNNREVLNAIGFIYLVHFDDTAKAIDFFEKATKADPNYSDAYNNLGVAYEKLGQFDKAIPFYKKAVSNLLYSTPEQAYRNMGNSYYRLGRYENALNSYKEALRRAPEMLAGKLSGFRLQAGLGQQFVLFDRRSGLLDLRLGHRTRLCQGCRTRLQRLLAAHFQVLEHCQAGFPQTLLVLRGPRLGRGNVSPRPFDGALSLTAPLRQNLDQGPMHEHRVGAIQQDHKDDGRDGSEQ
ncbi:MAG: tetratricopeptide repeat protein [Acidobacteriia bacterium]|nr:tetratricopeptide repeat protein [Terriglobia bacterium]